MDEQPSRRRLTRSHDRRLGGVCGGIADYFDVDPTVVRVAFIVALFIPAIGFGAAVAYVAGWIIIPEAEGAPAAGSTSTGRGVDGSMIFGLILVGAGLFFLLGTMGRGMHFPWFFGFNMMAVFWPLVLIGLGAFVLMNTRRDR